MLTNYLKVQKREDISKLPTVEKRDALDDFVQRKLMEKAELTLTDWAS
jgi:hypothetical protein